MTPAAKLRVQIHCACRDLGIDNDTRHDIQLAACGKVSMSDMTATDMRLVLNRLKEQGWDGDVKRAGKGCFKKAAPRADLRLVHVLWRLLGDAGALRDPSRRGLNAFLRSRFEKTWQSVPIDIDALRDHRQIDQVINALKDWCRREGVELKKGARS